MLSDKEAAKVVTRYVERCTDRVLQGTGVDLKVYGYVPGGLPDGLVEEIVTEIIKAFITSKLSVSARWN